jgi:hypothetical protein
LLLDDWPLRRGYFVDFVARKVQMLLLGRVVHQFAHFFVYSVGGKGEHEACYVACYGFGYGLISGGVWGGVGGVGGLICGWVGG